MIFTPNYIAIGQYFDKNKGKAMGLATVGSGLGAIIMPPLWTFMFGYYGYFGAMLIMGSIYLNNTVAGTLFRAIRRPKPITQRESINNQENQVERVEQYQGQIKGDDEQYKGQIKGDDEIATTPTCTDKIKYIFKSLSQKLKLLLNLGFLIHAFTMMSIPFPLQATVNYLPSWATEQGLSQQQTASLIMLTGVTDIIGRITSGLVIDHRLVIHRRHIVYKWLCIVFGLTTVAFCFSSSLVSFVIISLLWGLFEAGCHGQRITVVSDFVSPHQMADAVGVLIFFQGVGNFIAPLVSGKTISLDMKRCICHFVKCQITLSYPRGRYVMMLCKHGKAAQNVQVIKALYSKILYSAF